MNIIPFDPKRKRRHRKEGRLPWRRLAIGTAMAAFAALLALMLQRPTAASAAADAAAQGADNDAFTCTVTRVYDGDGPIHCLEGQSIRLSGIAAREMDESCRHGHPCPAASGAAARAALVRMTRGRILRCRAEGNSYNRVVASCTASGGRDLACAMIGTRTVVRWARYDPTGRLVHC